MEMGRCNNMIWIDTCSYKCHVRALNKAIYFILIPFSHVSFPQGEINKFNMKLKYDYLFHHCVFVSLNIRSFSTNPLDCDYDTMWHETAWWWWWSLKGLDDADNISFPIGRDAGLLSPWLTMTQQQTLIKPGPTGPASHSHTSLDTQNNQESYQKVHYKLKL